MFRRQIKALGMLDLITIPRRCQHDHLSRCFPILVAHLFRQPRQNSIMKVKDSMDIFTISRGFNHGVCTMHYSEDIACQKIKSSADNLIRSTQFPKKVLSIFEYLKTENVSIINEEKTLTLIKFLLKESLPPQHISEGLKENPRLCTIKLSDWTDAIAKLRDYGFQSDHLMIVLTANGKTFQTNIEHIYEVGETLRQVGIHDGALQKIITSCPELLTFSQKTIAELYNQLIKTFKKTEIVQLLIESPNLFVKDRKEIESIRNYVENKMGIGHHAMVQCCVFRYSLLHIKTRHLCLERLGRYLRPDPSKVVMNENAHLKQIIEYGDKNFSKKVAGITLTEYLAFTHMIKMEEDQQNNDLDKKAMELEDLDEDTLDVEI